MNKAFAYVTGSRGENKERINWSSLLNFIILVENNCPKSRRKITQCWGFKYWESEKIFLNF